MKKYSLYLASIMLMVIGFLIFFNSKNTYVKVEVFECSNFQKVGTDPVITIGSRESLKVISKAVSTGRKIDGILDVASPEYMLDIYASGGRKTTLYLWLGKGNIRGMYMYYDKTETGYSINEENTKQLSEILSIQIKGN